MTDLHSEPAAPYRALTPAEQVLAKLEPLTSMRPIIVGDDTIRLWPFLLTIDQPWRVAVAAANAVYRYPASVSRRSHDSVVYDWVRIRLRDLLPLPPGNGDLTIEMNIAAFAAMVNAITRAGKSDD